MRCPNPSCGRAIEVDATSHPMCGWNVRGAEESRQRSLADEEREKAAAERARQFAEKHGLKTVADHIAFFRKKLRSFGQRDPFETWCTGLTQKAVDRIFMLGGRDAERMRRRWLEAGVIDEHDKLVPLADRPARQAAMKEAAAKAQAEMEERRQKMIEQARAAEASA